MEVIGFRDMPINELIIDGDFRARIDHPRVKELAKSLDRTGQLHEPIVRMPHKKLLTGRDRVAGHVNLGRSKCMCKLVSCSDQEAKEIELAENARRRHDTEEQRKAIKQILDIYADQEREAPAPTGQVARRPIMKKAMARLAQERGVKPESIRRKVQRDRALEKKREEKEAFLIGAKDIACPIELIGMAVTDDFMRDVRMVLAQVRDISQRLQQVMVLITNLQGTKVPLPRQRFQRLYDELKAVASAARGLTPVSLCPWCKGLPGVQEHCGGCIGAGWISQDQAGQVPRDLWNTGKMAYVAFSGRYRKLDEMLDEIAPRPPAPVNAAELVDQVASELEGPSR